ncbi:MAG: hypothetical protein SGJ20_02600 [Planctomycetota bacterium]|nr:hypothetical protein [Planctomycetota bacterium]
MILFADTSYWVALSRAGDTHRRVAIDWQKRVLREGITLLTSEGVLWETLNSLSASPPRITADLPFASTNKLTIALV